jgi:hypothetical protein
VTADKFNALAQVFAERLRKELGDNPSNGFAIMVWHDGKLNHVTSDRATFAQMMGVQLGNWAQEFIVAEERELAALRAMNNELNPQQEKH